MGARGPQPKPTALRVLEGEKRPSRINANEPRPAEGLPECPGGVTVEVRAVWDYYIAQAEIMRTARPPDRDALHAYCEAVVLHRRAVKLVERDGVLIVGALGGLVRNPALTVVKQAAETIKVFGREFGFTPASRVGMTVTGADDDKGAQRLLG